MAYGTTTDADTYFTDLTVGRDEWFEYNDTVKQTALEHATRLIDTLAYRGVKTLTAQTNEFPRNGETTVPDEIEYATYEIAYQLLVERDPEYDFDLIPVVSHTRGPTKTERNPRHMGENLAYGIPSNVAWRYLLPYLLDVRVVRLNRVR